MKLPVLDLAITLNPPSTSGITFLWIGVGYLYPNLNIEVKRFSDKLKARNPFLIFLSDLCILDKLFTFSSSSCANSSYDCTFCDGPLNSISIDNKFI